VQMQVGDKVRARYRAMQHGAARTSWYPGTVAEVHEDGLCDIAYDDGDFEKRVSMKFIRVVSGQTTSPDHSGTHDYARSDKHLGLHQSKNKEDNQHKRQKVVKQPHTTEPQHQGAPSAPAAAQPATESPVSKPRPNTANTATSVPTPAAEVASDLDPVQNDVPESEHGDGPGLYRISKRRVLDSMPGNTRVLQPGMKFKVRLPDCKHLVKLSWPAQPALILKFKVPSCRKCAFVAQADQP